MGRPRPEPGRLSALAALTLLLLVPSLLVVPTVQAHDPIRDPIEYEERVLVDVNDDLPLHPELIDIVALDVGELYVLFGGDSFIYFKCIVRYRWDANVTLYQQILVSFARNGYPVNLSMVTFDGERWLSEAGIAVGFAYRQDPTEHEVYLLMPFRTLKLAQGDRLTDFRMETRANYTVQLSDNNTMPPFEVVADRAPEGTFVPGSTMDVPVGAPRQGPPLEDIGNRTTDDPLGGWEPSPENVTRIRPASGVAFRVGEHVVTDGRERFRVGLEPAVRWIKLDEEAKFSITVTSNMTQLDQRVLLFGRVSRSDRWFFGVEGSLLRDLPAGGETRFNVTLTPSIVDPAPVLDVPILVLSDLGGFGLVTLKARIRDLVTDPGILDEPRVPRVQFVSSNDRFRVNEPRTLLFYVADQNGLPIGVYSSVQAMIHRAGRPQEGVNYALDRKTFFEGVYQLPFVFRSTGDWVVNVTIFDEPHRPYEVFTLHVDRRPDPPHIIPPWLVLGALVLGVVLIGFRNRLQLLLQRRR